MQIGNGWCVYRAGKLIGTVVQKKGRFHVKAGPVSEEFWDYEDAIAYTERFFGVPKSLLNLAPAQ